MNTKYFLKLLKQKLWVSILFITSLAFIYIINYTTNITDTFFSHRSFVFSNFICSTLIYAVFLFVLLIVQFNFFHSKPKVDFYHNLPISRTKLFLTNYFVPIVLLTFPYIIFNIIFITHQHFLNIAHNANNPEYLIILNDFNIAFGRYIQVAIYLLFISLVLYSFAVFIGTITGNMASHAFLSVFSFIFPFLTIFITFIIVSITINSGVSPLENIVFDLSRLYTLQMVIICSILSIFFTYIALINYKNYKSETSGIAITKKSILYIFTAISPILPSLAIILMILAINYHSFNNTFISVIFFLSNILFFVIFTAIYNMSISFKNFKIKPFISLIIITFAYILIIFYNVLKIDLILPNPDKIDIAFINDNAYAGDDIQKVLDLNIKVSEEGYISYKYIEVYNSEEKILNALEESDIYLKFSYKYKNTNNYVDRYYYLPINSPIIEEIEELEPTMEKELYLSHLNSLLELDSFYTTDVLISFSENYYIKTSPIDSKQFLKAYIKDVENDENFTNKNQLMTIATIDFPFYLDKSYNENNFNNRSFNVNINYTNSLELLNKYYRMENSSNSNILDNILFYTQEHEELNKLKSIALQNGYTYINLYNGIINFYYDTPYNSKEAIKYSAETDEDLENLIEFLSTTYIPKGLMKLNSDEKIYGILNYKGELYNVYSK